MFGVIDVVLISWVAVHAPVVPKSSDEVMIYASSDCFVAFYFEWYSLGDLSVVVFNVAHLVVI